MIQMFSYWAPKKNMSLVWRFWMGPVLPILLCTLLIWLQFQNLLADINGYHILHFHLAVRDQGSEAIGERTQSSDLPWSTCPSGLSVDSAEFWVRHSMLGAAELVLEAWCCTCLVGHISCLVRNNILWRHGEHRKMCRAGCILASSPLIPSLREDPV